MKLIKQFLSLGFVSLQRNYLSEVAQNNLKPINEKDKSYFKVVAFKRRMIKALVTIAILTPNITIKRNYDNLTFLANDI